MRHFLDFERPIAELEGKVEELRHLSEESGLNIAEEVARLMRRPERFRLPVLTLVDTAGAYPGIDAEARGQSEAIARAIETCLDISVPLVAAIIGEGGSGGAVALAVGNRVLMLEHAVYSVISPEGCASIRWRDREHAKDVADAPR